jgi:hypothetical protein
MNPGIGSKDDAQRKAFSRLTSIQVFVGVKVFKKNISRYMGKTKSWPWNAHPTANQQT